jgi:hypothetical protein
LLCNKSLSAVNSANTCSKTMKFFVCCSFSYCNYSVFDELALPLFCLALQCSHLKIKSWHFTLWTCFEHLIHLIDALIEQQITLPMNSWRATSFFSFTLDNGVIDQLSSTAFHPETMSSSN